MLGATGAWLTYLATTAGRAGYAGWSLLVLVLLAAAATGFRRTQHPIAAGVFAFVAVIAFVAFLGALWTWFGWESASPTSSSFRGFHAARFLLELLWLVAAIVAVRTFRFPLLVAQAVLAGWIVVTDLLSNGGGWSAVVTLFVGLFYLAVALALDSGVRRPYGFWLHVERRTADRREPPVVLARRQRRVGLIAIAAVVFVFFSQPTGRSSWAVFGAIGLLLASAHFALEWTHVRLIFFSGGSGADRPWVSPLVFTCLGFVLVWLGVVLGRRSSAAAG